MADDREVLRAIWDGKIPVRFSLDRKEVHTADQPEPFYVSNVLIFSQYRSTSKDSSDFSVCVPPRDRQCCDAGA